MAKVKSIQKFKLWFQCLNKSSRYHRPKYKCLKHFKSIPWVWYWPKFKGNQVDTLGYGIGQSINISNKSCRQPWVRLSEYGVIVAYIAGWAASIWLEWWQKVYKYWTDSDSRHVAEVSIIRGKYKQSFEAQKWQNGYKYWAHSDPRKVATGQRNGFIGVAVAPPPFANTSRVSIWVGERIREWTKVSGLALAKTALSSTNVDLQ